MGHLKYVVNITKPQILEEGLERVNETCGFTQKGVFEMMRLEFE